MTDKGKNRVSTLSTDTCICPGGLTSHLQPADGSWYKPFKSADSDLLQ